jgi:hypothetical protein
MMEISKNWMFFLIIIRFVNVEIDARLQYV